MTTEPPVWSSPLTPLHFLRRSAAVFADRPAVIYGDRRTTYAEFNQRVNRLASALQAVGVQPGDRVAFLCPNIPQMLEAHYGVPLAGAILVPLNIRLTADEVGAILEHSGATVLVVDTEFARLVEPIRGQLRSLRRVVLVHDTGAHTALAGEDYEAFLGRGDPADRPLPLQDEGDLISINYTSGTTARPKGVMITHRNAYMNVVGTLIHIHMSPADRYLWTLPMFHANGWTFVWVVTAVGGAHVCLRRVVPDQVLATVAAERITMFCAAPTVLIGLAGAPEELRRDVPAGLRVLAAGAPPAAATIGRIEGELGWEIIHVYGMTETSPFISICEPRPEHAGLSPEERAAIKARQGVELVTSGELQVVDEEGRPVPRDGQTMGEIVARGNVVMAGYYRDPEATAAAIRDGWMHTGDAAVVHPDGYVEVRDRLKDVIISGGENISSVEVEGVLMRHPAVQEVAVVGLPDEQWGESPHAFVVLKPGARASEEELRRFARDRLAHFKAPHGVHFIEELPKTATGKIQKYVLRGGRAAIARQ